MRLAVTAEWSADGFYHDRADDQLDEGDGDANPDADQAGDQRQRDPGRGNTPGHDGVAIALDPAATGFYRDGAYHVAGEALSTSDMIVRYEEIVVRYPVWSIEDGLAESDWDGWIALTERLIEIGADAELPYTLG